MWSLGLLKAYVDYNMGVLSAVETTSSLYSLSSFMFLYLTLTVQHARHVSKIELGRHTT
jgi:hypothetical protein